MKAICIDNSNKPEGISEYEWLEEGAVYTIIEIVEMALQDGKLGIALAEIELTEASAPYKYYSLERFLLIPEDALITLKKTKETIREEVANNIEHEDEDIDIDATDADLSSLI